MSWFKSSIQKVFTLTLALVIVSFVFLPLNQFAQEEPQGNFIFQLITGAINWAEVAIFSPQPPGAAATDIGDSIGARGPICAVAERSTNNELIESVVALMPIQATEQINDGLQTSLTVPDESPDGGVGGGRTVDENPIFWFYVPYVAASETPEIRVSQFVLLDELKQPVWNELIAVELLQTPRLVEYSLKYPLETNKLYRWHFSVICDSEKPSRNPIVRGWVQRTEPSAELQIALRNANLLQSQEYVVYARNGIWFETINSLVKSRRQFPSVSRFREDLIGLLTYFGIPEPDQLDFTNPAKIVERKESIANQSQLPARM